MKPLSLAALALYVMAFASVAACVMRDGARLLRALPIAFVGAGLAVHTLALLLRAFASGRLPVASVGETLLFYSWCTAAITLVVMARYNERPTALVTLPFAALALFFSALNMPEPAELPLILRTYWFEIHVVASFAAYALFTVAFAGAALFLYGRAFGGGAGERLAAFQDVASRGALWGFFFFSASMFAGAVWGYLAWGSYWIWEPKMLWSFVVWFWYAGTLHVWYVRDWKETGLAVAAVTGLFVVAFTYLGVGLLMKSSHSF